MTRLVRHVLIPAVVPIVFLAVWATPVEVMGCFNRGLTAAIVALIGGLAGLGAAIMGVMGRVRRDPKSFWWVASALILAIPAVVIVIIA
jgi:uncharacterized membrane protein YjfL (UPF0719 family)